MCADSIWNMKSNDESWHRSRQRNRKIIATAKDVPCTDCGGRFPLVCMDFDHVRDDKVRDIAHMETSSVERLMSEIAKCDVVCSNCHRIRTAIRVHGHVRGAYVPRGRVVSRPASKG